MKKLYLKTTLILLSLSISNRALSQSWEYVGSPGFSGGPAIFTTIAIDPSDIPFVAFVDGANGGRATVMKYVSGSWVAVGSPGFSDSIVSYTSIAIDQAGEPYVVYNDFYRGGKATVMKYSSGSWAPVGSPGFSSGLVKFLSIKLDSHGTPYVAYQDFDSAGKATVMKYDGSNWLPLGNRGFSAGNAEFTSIAIDSDNNVYVAYADATDSCKVTVMKYEGSSWVTVGSPGISTGLTNTTGYCWYTSIALDKGGIPYVFYSYGLIFGGGGTGTVVKYADSNWVTVGSADFTYSAEYNSLFIDKNGTPYIVYGGISAGYAWVEKYDGSNWVQEGSGGSSPGMAFYTSIAVDGNGIPYIVFEDPTNGRKVSVMRPGTWARVSNTFNNKTGQYSVFPNPSQNKLTITTTDKITTVSISNLLGQTVYTQSFNTQKAEIDISMLQSGVYFVKINGREMAKFVKE
jgi:type IX secretion system substrate protein